LNQHESSTISARDLRDGDVVWVDPDTYARVSIHQSEAPEQVVTVSYVLPDLLTGGTRMTATYPAGQRIQILARAVDRRFTSPTPAQETP
jgi:hypothetical protein